MKLCVLILRGLDAACFQLDPGRQVTMRRTNCVDPRCDDGTFVGVRIDITEMKEREKALRRSMRKTELYRHVLDEAWSVLREEVPELQRAPSEYIHDHVWFTSQPIEEPDDPDDFLRTVEQGRLSDRLMFATDYPHWDFDAPSQALPRGLAKETRARILAGTACELYGLPLGNGRESR